MPKIIQKDIDVYSKPFDVNEYFDACLYDEPDLSLMSTEHISYRRNDNIFRIVLCFFCSLDAIINVYFLHLHFSLASESDSLSKEGKSILTI